MGVSLEVVQFVVVDSRVLRFEVAEGGEVSHAAVLACAGLTLILVLLHGVQTTRSVEVDELVAVCAHAVVLTNHVVCRVVIIVIIDAAAPALHLVASLE